MLVPLALDEYLFAGRGTVDVKGIGELRKFFLVGRRGDA
jgi:hypothetical protein